MSQAGHHSNIAQCKRINTIYSAWSIKRIKKYINKSAVVRVLQLACVPLCSSISLNSSAVGYHTTVFLQLAIMHLSSSISLTRSAVGYRGCRN